MRTFCTALAIVGLSLFVAGCTSSDPATQQKLNEAGKEISEAGEHVGEALEKGTDAFTDVAGEAVEEGKKALNEAAGELKEATNSDDTTVKPESDAVKDAPAPAPTTIPEPEANP